MGKIIISSAVLSLFLLVPASITWAQKISSQKGLVTAVYSTQYGNVKIYLPDDIRPGDLISGTIVAEASGNNEKQIARNLDVLLKSTLRFNNENFPVDQANKQFHFNANQIRPLQEPMELILAGGGKPIQLNIPSIPVNEQKPSGSECMVPTHVLTGSQMKITGPFDGNSSNTKCRIGGEEIPIIAESPRSCIVLFPQNAKGMQTVQISENGLDPCTRQVSGVDMQVSTGKLNLRKGENTFIDVKVTGLENLPDKATLTITNATPSIVTITNGNIQVIPIWPPANSTEGNFSIHCPAVSLSTGIFSVNINLDLPQPGDAITPSSEVPPGYTKKSCDCGVSVTVSKTGNAFNADAKPVCKGVYGIGINTFPVCGILSTAYKWSVKSGQENVELVGKTDGSSLNTNPKNNGAYTVCVIVTVTCSDGTVCTAQSCLDQAGRTVSTPGEEKNPPTTSRCNCSASCEVIAGPKTGTEISFTAKINAACSGSAGSGGTRAVCAVGPILYTWSIGESGKDVAEIVGKGNGPSVKVKLKKNGAYNIYLVGTVTCSDGTSCPFSCSLEVPYIPDTNEKVCLPGVDEIANPPIDGGLKNKQTGSTSSNIIFRDDYIALEAVGSDIDLVTFKCDPQKPCPDSRSEKTIPVTGKVRFEWTINSGEGKFVKLGCAAEDEKNDKGEHVIFQPPYVPSPVKNADTTFTTVMTLFIIDDGSPVPDKTVLKIITIKITRKKSVPDKYTVEIIGGAPGGPVIPAVAPVSGSCRLIGPNWNPKDDLVKPGISLPSVPDKDKMVLGQWIVLGSQDQKDPDDVIFNCSSSNCTSSSGLKSYPDNIIWEWTIIAGGGQFILGNRGQNVIYEAPMEMPKGKDVIEVRIKVKVMNAAGERMDPAKTSDEFTLRIYQPGIRLSQSELTWLPQEDNSLELKSELMYKDGDWKPALAHMCRIHYFELLNVSTEKGVCLNSPEPKYADDCRDLKINNESGQEAFDETKGAGKCDRKDMYQQARTNRPEKEYSIKIYSLDFGSYGFLRSFANVNRKISLEGKPVYQSIPVKISDVVHPLGRSKKTEYPDNRVTIPQDIDENRIADGGWASTGGVVVNDPADNKIDEDDKPTGDSFKGDGFTNYEEYRGFKISTNAGVIHQRTNYEVKDIFIRKEGNLPIDLYANISELDAHEITEAQYISDDKRFVNFNFNRTTHLNFEQRGLHLVDKGTHSSLLGIAYSSTGQPTVPNAEIEIRLYTTKIKASVDRVNTGVAEKDKLVYSDKLAAVVAHELLHGNNVCHHGEGDPEIEKAFDLIHGLRSGDVVCVMRYDNVGTPLSRIPEKPGISMCISAAGTGYNAGGLHFQSAAAGRGNCKTQIRVSGAGGIPKSCGNR